MKGGQRSPNKLQMKKQILPLVLLVVCAMGLSSCHHVLVAMESRAHVHHHYQPRPKVKHHHHVVHPKHKNHPVAHHRPALKLHHH